MQLRSLALVALAGCLPTPDFSSDLERGGGDSSGVSNGKLGFDIAFVASSDHANARERSELTTSYLVRAARDGVSVTDAEVTVHSNEAATELVYDATVDGFVGTEAGYPEGFLLDVHAGDDYAVGILYHGPLVHTITAPAENATVPIDGTTTLTYESEDTNGQVTITTPVFDSSPLLDEKSFTLNPGTFAPGPQQLVVTRTTQLPLFMTIPGGMVVAGGNLSVGVRNYIDVVGQ